MHKIRIALFLLLTVLMTLAQYNPNPLVLKPRQPVISIREVTDYELHPPIKILNDNDFETYGFDGFGTPDEPYLIDSYFMSDSTSDLIHIENTNVYFTIRNCYFNGLSYDFHCIALINVNHAIIDSNIICNPGNGIVLSSSNQITLSSNTIYNCVHDGIRLSYSSNYNVLSSNTIYNCLRDGICLSYSSSYNTLTSNMIYNCTRNGILLRDSNIYNTLSNNTIYNCDVTGIQHDTNNNYNTLSNNTIYNCADEGIALNWSIYCTLSANTIYDCSQTGISLVDSTHSTLSNNTVYNCFYVGIGLNSSNHCTLSNNMVYNCTTGIVQNWSDYCTLFSNTVSNCTFSCLYLSYSTYSTLDSNTVYDCSYNGIELRESSSYNTLSGNTVSNCSDNGIKLWEFSNNNTLSYNTVDNCTSNGISLIHLCHYNIISYNTISHCSNDGIALGDVNYSTLFSNSISHCSHLGIYLSLSCHNTLSSNMIINCSIHGIVLDSYSKDNTMSSNMISHCSDDGIYLNYWSDHNTLVYNTISHCSNNGIELQDSNSNTVSYNTVYNNSNYGFIFGPQDSSNNNVVNWNNFINNNVGGTSQGYDAGTINNISYNYWDDWTTPDATEPYGIVDLPYFLEGTATNYDPSPLTTPKPPLMNIVTPINKGYSTDTITVILSGNAIHYWYSIYDIDGDNQTWIIIEERTLDDGTYTLHAYGEILSTIFHVSVMFTIDTTPPPVYIISPTSIIYTTSTITVDLSGDADVAHFWYYIEGFHVENQIWTDRISWSLADGTYILHAYANDTIGNIVSVSVAFKIDTMAPTITLESPPHDTIHNSWTIIKVNVIDVFLDTVLYNWDGNTNKTWNGDYEYWTLLPINETQHILNVYANDSLGRWATEVFVFTTDDTSPAVDVTSPTNITYNQNYVTLTYTVSDGKITIYINGLANTTALPSGVMITNLQDGTYNISIVAVDSAGNIGNATVIFTIDTPEEQTSETTSSSHINTFSGLFPILLFLVSIVVFLRRHES